MNGKMVPGLPENWVWTMVGACTEIILGQSPPSTTYNENGNGLPFYQGKLEFGNIFPTPLKWCTAPKKIAEKGDVLISVRAPVGPTNICPEKSCIGRGLAAIRPLNGMESFFILYLLRAFEDGIAGKGTGTTFNAITGNQLKEFAIPLPPLPEQHRIVTKIEELFTQLDAGVGALTKAKAQLKHYRQSMLKSACEGGLVPTEAELARAEGRDYEPADVLLARIGKERREKWEAEKKRKDKKSAKYKEPAALDVSGLPGLPEGWCRTTVGQLIDSMKNGIYKPREFYTEDGIACLRMYNIDQGKIVWKDIKRMNLTKKEIDEYLLESGDLLVNRVNSRELVGKAAVIPSGLEKCVFESKNIRVKVLDEVVNPYYLSYRFTSAGTEYFNRNAQQVVGMASISQPQIAKFPVSLPPLPEQHRIVAEVERRLSIADETKKTVEQSLKHAERLRQSILKRAFEGKLVPQDSNDEPASVLLKRIKEEKVRRDAEEKAKKKSKTKPKRKKMKVRKDAETEKQTVELYEILRLSKVPLTLKELWQSSKLEIEDFYDQLKIEVEKGRIIERRRSNSDVFMEIVI
jgi:type I restriction enzyme S subunit